MSDAKYWLGFNLVKGIGPAKLQALLDYYGNIETAWRADPAGLARLGLDKRTIQSLSEARAELDLDREYNKLAPAGIALVTWNDPQYPRYLREVPQAPPVLFIRGRISDADEWAVAVVGTRRLTVYGRQVVHDIVTGLALNGVTIVSGLARGIDALAHKAAVDAGGRTIAVLGSGLDNIYPPEHRKLADQIVQENRGAIVSEYALGVKPDARNFPPRNRIISGLSLGTIVIEAGERSGALITANFALEQDREVFAIPGNINSPASAGTNRLIQQGAKLVTGVEDVLEELNLTMIAERVSVQAAIPETAEEAALLDTLTTTPVHIDDLSRASGLPAALVSSTLTLMELKGIVQQVGGMNYIRVREPEVVYEIKKETQ